MPNRSRKSLSDFYVDRLKARDTDLKVWDAGIPGFGFRITPKGFRSWIVQFTRSGKKVTATLGTREEMSTQEAREEADRLRKLHKKGVDILAHLKERDGAKTVQDAVNSWEANKVQHLKPTTVASYRSIIKNCLLPQLGKRLIKDLALDDVRAFHKALEKTPTQANRAVAVLSSLITMAIDEQWRESDNPCHRFRRTAEIPKTCTFSVDEYFQLNQALNALVNEKQLDPAVADLVRFIALSGLRSGEALSLQWASIDVDRNIMRFNNHKTDKNGTVPKILPLNTHLIDILNRRKGLLSSAYVFPSAVTNGQFKGLGKCWNRIRERAKLGVASEADLTLHDLRRSFRTYCAELEYGDSTGDTLLGHGLGKVKSAYIQFRPDGIIGKASQATADWIHSAMQGKKPRIGVAVEPDENVSPRKKRS